MFDCNLTDLHLHSVTVQLHLIGIRKNIVSECSGKSEVVVTSHCVSSKSGVHLDFNFYPYITTSIYY